MCYITLTVDYEIFGNGTGDVRQHIIAPAERMARVCERHNVQLVVFFELEEYLSFERNRSELRARLGYDPADMIRRQIVDFARRGHDIQLHLHPEWVDARFENGEWHLHEHHRTVDSLFTDDESTRRRQESLQPCSSPKISTNGSGRASLSVTSCSSSSPQEAANAYIAKRKQFIDEMLTEAGVSQRVCVYRAGAFSAQPGKLLLNALVANGITIDSSVVKGLIRSGPHVAIDYRGVPSWKDPWRVSDDVATSDPSGPLWEFPIYAEPGRRWRQLTLGRLKAKFSGNVPKGKQMDTVKQLGIPRTAAGILKFLRQAVPIKLDYHNVTPSGLMRMIRSAPKASNGLPDFLVTIGHTKEHIDDQSLEKFLKLATADPNLKFVSFTKVAEMMKSYGDGVGRKVGRDNGDRQSGGLSVTRDNISGRCEGRQAIKIHDFFSARG